MQHSSRDRGGERPEVDFNDVFSLRKPRDAKAGLASGAKSMAKGVIAGAVGLFAAPAIGAHLEGFSGFAKGAATGIVGAVLLPVAGVAVGATQMVRGIANSPEAWRERSAGKHWDEEQRCWVSEPTRALALDDGAAAHLRAPLPGEALDDYYGLLGVPRTASPEEIKRAYYVTARRLHPDKNPGDPSAHERFQALAQAYQVLGNEELRRRYDTHGTEGLNNVNFVDGADFFAALFGSDRFEHLVGELMLAAAARAGPELTAAGMRRLQAAREARLEVLLAALLRRAVEGDEEGFRASMAAETAELVQASFGEVMLHTIGRVYEVQATIQLGGLVDGSLARLRAQGRSLKVQFKAAGLALRVLQAQQRLSRLHEQAERVQGEAAKAKLLQQEQQLEAELRQAEVLDVPEADAPSDAVHKAGVLKAGHAAAAGAGSNVGGNSPPGSLGAGPAARRPPGPSAPPSVEELTAAAASIAAERVRVEEDSLPLMLEAMWAANVMDIESTLRHVCKRVLNDPGVGKEQRRARAHALFDLGRIMRAAKAPAAAPSAAAARPGSGSAKQQMEAAMMHVIERRMQESDGAAGRT